MTDEPHSMVVIDRTLGAYVVLPRYKREQEARTRLLLRRDRSCRPKGMDDGE